MKKTFFLFAALLASLSLTAQQPYMPTVEGTVLKYETLNAKGKVEGSGYTETVTSVTEAKGATQLVMTRDMDGFPLVKNYTIKGGNLIVPKENLYPADILAMQGVSVELSGNDLVYPGNLAVGDELPTYTISAILTFELAPGQFEIQDVTPTERKCVAIEEITVPAGTFNCVVIEESVNYTARANGQTNSVITKTKTWYSEGVGTVKEQTFTNRGKLQSTTQLTEIIKPESI